MTTHPNAHILAQLAAIAKTDPEQWLWSFIKPLIHAFTA